MEWLKERVIYNVFYGTVDEIRANVESFVSYVNENKGEVVQRPLQATWYVKPKKRIGIDFDHCIQDIVGLISRMPYWTFLGMNHK